MPILLPDLDTYSYDDLIAEARLRIPNLSPQWTNHNPSDPGIMLVELLAWISEMVLYQINDISDSTIEAFLKLLNGSQWSMPQVTDPAQKASVLDVQIAKTVRALRERYRAVTSEDFVWLATAQWPNSPEAAALGPKATLTRAQCFPNRNLEAATRQERARSSPGHVSLVVLPETELSSAEASKLCAQLWQFLDPRRTLTTQHHVVMASRVTVYVVARLILREDVLPDAALIAARQRLNTYVNPFIGGDDGAGWPFGHPVYASDLYALLGQLAMVDYVEQLCICRSPEAALKQVTKPFVAPEAHQLVTLNTNALTATTTNRRGQLAATYGLTQDGKLEIVPR
jgi:hypothetical protein